MDDQCGGDKQPAGAGQSNDLSGVVLGPSVQAGTIQGGVHFYGASERPPVPRQLPPRPAHFINRAVELDEMGRLFEVEGASIVVLTGPGGVGKTALATCWAHGAKAGFPDGHLYVDLRGFSGGQPLDPGEALAGFLRALGVAPQRVPVTLPEQAAMFRTVTADRSLLMLLDNAVSAAQVRVLMPGAASAVLVTSRSRLAGLVPDGARLLSVGPLPDTDAMELLSRTVGRDRVSREREPAEALAAICGGLPLALCVAAARLAARPRFSLRGMVTELADEAVRLERLSTQDGTSVRAAFEISYRSLDPDVAMLYRRLSLHPGPEFGIGPGSALLDSDGGGATSVNDAVANLVGANLLEEVTEDRLRYHDLVRLHAREKVAADERDEDRAAALRSILEWYLAAAVGADQVLTPYRRRLPYTFSAQPIDLPRFDGRAEALNWFEAERANLILAGRAALEQGLPDLSWQLCDVMWPLLLYHKHYTDRVTIDECGLRAARAWGNPWAEADMLKRLGRIRTKTGEYETAERHIQAAVTRYREAGDLRGSLDAEEGLAALYRDTGRERQAAEVFARVLVANRATGDERSTGLTCISLGMCLTRLDRPAEALPLLVEAREVFARLADVDPYNGVRVLIGLADVHLATGDLPAAEGTATDAVRGMRDLGSDHERAEALYLLGRIAQRRGDLRAARRHYGEALAIFRELGSARAGEVTRQSDQLDIAPTGDHHSGRGQLL